MANVADKLKENVEGKYYVDSTCISCGVCVSVSPNIFKMSDDGKYAFVFNQPQTAADIQNAEDSLSQCPVNAIGNDLS